MKKFKTSAAARWFRKQPTELKSPASEPEISKSERIDRCAATLFEFTRAYCKQSEHRFFAYVLAWGDCNGVGEAIDEWLEELIEISAVETVYEDRVERKANTCPQYKLQWFCMASAVMLYTFCKDPCHTGDRLSSLGDSYLSYVAAFERRQRPHLYYHPGQAPQREYLCVGLIKQYFNLLVDKRAEDNLLFMLLQEVLGMEQSTPVARFNDVMAALIDQGHEMIGTTFSESLAAYKAR